VKIDFENAERASDVHAVKGKKTAKIRDQVFLATRITVLKPMNPSLGLQN
jgi:hypothetical protein